MSRKHRKCPHCGSKTGFKVTIRLGGYQDEIRDFNGNLIDCDRVGTDTVDTYAECVDCKKSIETDKLECD